MTGSKPFILIDGSSYLYRAFHALPALTSSKGEPTGAIHGVLNMLHKLLNDYQPELVAVVFDAKGKTFRDDLYADYKANRPPMPDELRAQIEPLLEAVQALGLPLLRISGVEADDVIGTLARQASEQGMHTVVSTGDKDMAQLVDDHVTLVNTMTETVLDRDGVIGKFDVAPEQIIDYLALVGDSSDNIPGVPKVGPKTAAKWLGKFGTLDRLVEQADSVAGKVGESLRDNLEQLALSRTLATIRCDVELEGGPRELKRGEPDQPKLRELYTRLELKNLLRRLDESNPPTEVATPPEPSPEADYTTIVDLAELGAWIERLNSAELAAFDTETTSLNYMQAEIVGVSFSVAPGEAAYVPLAHIDPDTPEQLDRDEVLTRLKPWLEDPGLAKLGHHLKYDAHVLANHGITLAGMRYDTMLESYVLNSNATRHDLDSTALAYLGVNTVHFEDIAGKGAKQIRFDQVPVAVAANYAAEDADICLRLHHHLWQKLEAIPPLRKLYEQIEQPLVEVLRRMESHGVLVDQSMLQKQSRELADKMFALEQAAHEAAGSPFNLGSTKQLQEILFDRLGLPVIRKTPKGQPSTAEDVLQELAADYELPRLVLEYRGLSKLKSTYTDKLPLQINPDTRRIHTSYHQAVAVTGRLASSDPNLQNIPIRTPEGRRIRRAFVAPPGYTLIAADYSQIELRIMAHLSEDEGLLRAFAEDQDIHRATAAEVFDLPKDSVSDDQRRSAKAINFGLIYGMSAFGLARQLGIDRSAAQSYVDLYFARYPGVKDYMDRIRIQAREQGFVETVFGRRLYLADINARNAQRRQYAERSAINAPMQGTAADVIKRAMLDVVRWLDETHSKARLIMQVHDELVFEAPKEAAPDLAQQLAARMSAAAELRVPLKVDAGIGSSWDEAH